MIYSTDFARETTKLLDAHLSDMALNLMKETIYDILDYLEDRRYDGN